MMPKTEFIVPDECEQCDFFIYRDYIHVLDLPYCNLFNLYLPFRELCGDDKDICKHYYCGMVNDATRGIFKGVENDG